MFIKSQAAGLLLVVVVGAPQRGVHVVVGCPVPHQPTTGSAQDTVVDDWPGWLLGLAATEQFSGLRGSTFAEHLPSPHPPRLAWGQGTITEKFLELVTGSLGSEAAANFSAPWTDVIARRVAEDLASELSSQGLGHNEIDAVIISPPLPPRHKLVAKVYVRTMLGYAHVKQMVEDGFKATFRDVVSDGSMVLIWQVTNPYHAVDGTISGFGFVQQIGVTITSLPTFTTFCVSGYGWCHRVWPNSFANELAFKCLSWYYWLGVALVVLSAVLAIVSFPDPPQVSITVTDCDYAGINPGKITRL